jgi:hypothetical protein
LGLFAIVARSGHLHCVVGKQDLPSCIDISLRRIEVSLVLYLALQGSHSTVVPDVFMSFSPSRSLLLSLALSFIPTPF